jgi:DNA-binding response OmpR family regulator
MGLQLDHEAEGLSAEGELPLSTTPFETLRGSFRAERAHFYTLGHSRLKFCQPTPFFHLPAVDVSGCESIAQIESALRRAWASRSRDLYAAKAWLDGLSATMRVAARGTRLLLPLTGVDGPPAQVQSRTSIHLPSSGPLAEVSLNAPGERSHRPRPDLEHSSDLEIEVSEAMQRLARRCAETRRAPAPTQQVVVSSPDVVRRVLVVDRDRATLTAAETLLLPEGFQTDTFQAPERALAAFRSRSYDLVLAAARMPRGDGLEFTALVRELPGIENLPIVLMDDRISEMKKREAIAAGAAGYFRKPLVWSEIRERLTDLLERTSLRRFERFAVQLPVYNQSGNDAVAELTEQVARGGFALRSSRQLRLDTVERYLITLPNESLSVAVEGQVIYLDAVPGDTVTHAGIRVLRFLDDHEPDWIRLIEELVRRASSKGETPAS